MTEPTEAEMRRRLLEIECARDGHGPAHSIRSYGGLVIQVFCDCGKVSWTPSSKASA